MASLDQIPYDLWDFEFQFTDLLDFLEFSESNIEFQRKTKIQNLQRMAKQKNLEYAEYAAELQNIEGRYDISLARNLRYSVLISLASTVEWISEFLNSHVAEEIPDNLRPRCQNKSIYRLNTLILRANCEHHNLDTLEKIIKIRNCLIHSLGSVKYYEHREEIKNIISTLNGFNISDSHFIEEVIEIDKGAIEQIISETQSWVTGFIDECRQKAIINM